jgi:hypothetical protein
MEGILAMEEEHADDLVSLLEELDTSKKAKGKGQKVKGKK